MYVRICTTYVFKWLSICSSYICKHSGFYSVIVDFKTHKIKEMFKNLRQEMVDYFNFVSVPNSGNRRTVKTAPQKH